ncbi:MAG: hypothetical protein NC238_16210 [Dehalobacter sp.]|nr:hypothetical protein [Dehalobacter sp.]
MSGYLKNILSQINDLKRGHINKNNKMASVDQTITQRTGSLSNAFNHLNISTYDGSGQCIHPCVICVDSLWNDYRYIMVYTPFPDGDDHFENPSLRGSDDGVEWYQWADQPDPIVPQPSVGFHSDPNIAFAGSTLYLFYRYNDRPSRRFSRTLINRIYFITSTHPDSWTTPILTDLPWIRSPSFHFNEFTWECWGHDMKTGKMLHFTSDDAIHWIEDGTVTCYIEGYRLWHSEIKKIDGIYQMLMTANTPQDLYELFFLSSNDGLNWALASSDPLLSPSISGWDNGKIYKSSFVKVDDKYKIWYSAMSRNNLWNIGLVDNVKLEPA